MLITTSEKDIYRFGVLSVVRTRQLRLVDVAVTLAVLFVLSGEHLIDAPLYEIKVSRTLLVYDCPPDELKVQRNRVKC